MRAGPVQYAKRNTEGPEIKGSEGRGQTAGRFGDTGLADGNTYGGQPPPAGRSSDPGVPVSRTGSTAAPGLGM